MTELSSGLLSLGVLIKGGLMCPCQSCWPRNEKYIVMKLRNTLLMLFWALFIASPMMATQPFEYQNFDQGFPASWVTGDPSNQGVLWEYCSDFHDCPPATFQLFFCRQERFESPTVENGYLFVNSYALQNPPSPHQSFLRSNTIDCSQKAQVFLRFSTFIAGGESLPEKDAVVRVKAGASGWQEYKVFHHLDENSQTLNSWNPQVAVLDLSDLAANQPDVQVEWRWTGKNGFFWAIDDVEFFDENPVYERAVWGNVPGQGDFSGGLNNWTVTSTGDSCRWIWDNTGVIDLPDADVYANAVGCSPSLPNGVATVNASFCLFGGTTSPYTRSDLISPAIDLSGIPAGTRLALRFDQLVSIVNPSNPNLPVTSVLLSLDGGNSFIDTLDANPILPYQKPFCGTTTLDLPIGVAGSASFRMVFVFAGDAEYWMVDDVRIVEQFDRDLRISPTFFSIAPNYATPAGLVQPFGFQADVDNIGQEPMDLATLYLTVKKDATGEIVHRDTLLLGSMMPGESALDVYFPKTYSPPPLAADYTCQYEVKSSQSDENPLDNVARWKFEVTDDVFSKDKGECFINGSFTPNGSHEYEIGNCFFIPAGTHPKATSISFAFRLVSSELIGRDLRIRLYKWKTPTTWGDVNGDTLATADEYTEVSFNIYTIVGDEKYNELITVPVDPINPYVQLEDSTYYFATVGFEDIQSQAPFFISGSEELNYTSMFWTSYQIGPPGYVSMLRLGNDDYFRANGWGLQRIPIVRLNVDNVNSTGEAIPVPPSMFEIYPNPTAGRLVINFSEKTHYEGLTVEILDIWGRLVATRQFDNTFVSQLPIDLDGLSNGHYILRVVTDGFSSSKSFFIVKH